MSEQSIYLSDWQPRGVRKEWEKTSLKNEDAARIIGTWADGKIIDACGWFASDDVLRVMVADTDNNTRFTVRRQGRGWNLKRVKKS